MKDKFKNYFLKGLPLFVALIALVFSLWNFYKTRESILDLEWADAVNNDIYIGNSITPQVGTIQFLKNGFSISLESVSYNVNGLNMTGFIGNPTNLFLSNLTIEFTARKPFYSFHDSFVKKDYVNRAFFSPEQIGKGQTRPINILSPGMSARFEVTIPNVKQTEDTLDIKVSFTGERFSYR
jgi:hypothetical protein